jgi:hypothetical protein
MAKYSKKAGDKVEKVMREKKKGSSGSSRKSKPGPKKGSRSSK